jgi:hypothetical protein
MAQPDAANENWQPSDAQGQHGAHLWVPHSVVAQAGRVSNQPPPPSPPSGGDPMTELATKVKGVFVWLTFLTGGFAVAFMFLLSRIDFRFDSADSNLRQVQMSVSAQTETLKAIDQRFSSMEKKLEDRQAATTK